MDDFKDSLTRVNVSMLMQDHQDLIRKREQVMADLRAAREEGDLVNNEAYHQAKQKQEIIDRRIKAIEEQLSRLVNA